MNDTLLLLLAFLGAAKTYKKISWKHYFMIFGCFTRGAIRAHPPKEKSILVAFGCSWHSREQPKTHQQIHSKWIVDEVWVLLALQGVAKTRPQKQFEINVWWVLVVCTPERSQHWSENELKINSGWLLAAPGTEGSSQYWLKLVWNEHMIRVGLLLELLESIQNSWNITWIEYLMICWLLPKLIKNKLEMKFDEFCLHLRLPGSGQNLSKIILNEHLMSCGLPWLRGATKRLKS